MLAGQWCQGPGLESLHVLGLLFRVLRCLLQLQSPHRIFRSKKPRASKSWEFQILSFPVTKEERAFQGPSNILPVVAFWSELGHRPWSRPDLGPPSLRPKDPHMKQNEVRILLERRDSLWRSQPVFHVHTVSLSLSMLAWLPGTPVCLPEGLLLLALAGLPWTPRRGGRLLGWHSHLAT